MADKKLSRDQLVCLWFGVLAFAVLGIAAMLSNGRSRDWHLVIIGWPLVAVATAAGIYTLRVVPLWPKGRPKSRNQHNQYRRNLIRFLLVCLAVALMVCLLWLVVASQTASEPVSYRRFFE